MNTALRGKSDLGDYIHMGDNNAPTVSSDCLSTPKDTPPPPLLPPQVLIKPIPANIFVKCVHSWKKKFSGKFDKTSVPNRMTH